MENGSESRRGGGRRPLSRNDREDGGVRRPRRDYGRDNYGRDNGHYDYDRSDQQPDQEQHRGANQDAQESDSLASFKAILSKVAALLRPLRLSQDEAINLVEQLYGQVLEMDLQLAGEADEIRKSSVLSHVQNTVIRREGERLLVEFPELEIKPAASPEADTRPSSRSKTRGAQQEPQAELFPKEASIENGLATKAKNPTSRTKAKTETTEVEAIEPQTKIEAKETEIVETQAETETKETVAVEAEAPKTKAKPRATTRTTSRTRAKAKTEAETAETTEVVAEAETAGDIAEISSYSEAETEEEPKPKPRAKPGRKPKAKLEITDDAQESLSKPEFVLTIQPDLET